MALFTYVECERGDTVPKDAIRDFGISAVGPDNYIYARAKCPSGDYVLGVATTVSSKEALLQFPQESMAPKAKKQSRDEELYILQECHYFDKKLGEYTCVDKFEVLTSQAQLMYMQCNTGSAPPNGALVGCFNDRTGPSYYTRCSYRANCTHRKRIQALPLICYGTVGMRSSFSSVLGKARASKKLEENKGFDEFDVLILKDIKDDIKKVDFDNHRAVTFSEQRVLKSMKLVNKSSSPLKRRFSCKESLSNEICLTRDFGAAIRPGTEIRCAWPSLTQHGGKFNVDKEYTIKWGKKQAIPEYYNDDFDVEVPPNLTTEYSAVVTKTTLDVPFKIHWLSGNVTVGKWHSVSNWGFKINHQTHRLGDKIVRVEFDIENGKVDSAPKVIAVQELTNETDSVQESTFTYSEGATDQKYFQHECGLDVKVGTTFKCGLPFIAEGTINLDVGASYKGQWGENLSETKSFTGSVPVSVPPNTAVTCTSEFTEEKLTVPYEMHWLSGNVSKGKWHSFTSYNCRTKFVQNELKQSQSNLFYSPYQLLKEKLGMA